MGRHADSQTLKDRKKARAREDNLQHAIEGYHQATADALLLDDPRPSFTLIAEQYGVSKETLRRRIRGGRSQIQRAEAASHLNQSESNILVEFLLQQADRGFPLTRDGVYRHALEIARVRNPDLHGFSPNWADRFLERHADQLNTKWTHNLESARAAAANPVVIEHWYALLKAQLDEYNFLPGDMYGFDESGFPFGTGQKVKVIARKGTKCQQVQRDGNRENVTVMVTICADGTDDVPPTIIFKGKNFNKKWAKNNPLKAS